MAYVNYWRWKTPIADADTFAEWSSDIQYLLDELSMPERELPAYAYGGGPNAYQRRYTPVFYRTHISGPSGRGEAVITPTKVAFNGNASLGEACEPFIVTLGDLKTANPFASCKTRAEPYDLLVICALVRLAHYFPEVLIASDGEEHTLSMAVRICREVFGDTRLPVVGHWQDEEESLSG
jgi:hypothetical protein